VQTTNSADVIVLGGLFETADFSLLETNTMLDTQMFSMKAKTKLQAENISGGTVSCKLDGF